MSVIFLTRSHQSPICSHSCSQGSPTSCLPGWRGFRDLVCTCDFRETYRRQLQTTRSSLEGAPGLWLKSLSCWLLSQHTAACLVLLGLAVSWWGPHRAHTWAALEGKNQEPLLLPGPSQHSVPRSFVSTNRTYATEHSRACPLTLEWGKGLGCVLGQGLVVKPRMRRVWQTQLAFLRLGNWGLLRVLEVRFPQAVGSPLPCFTPAWEVRNPGPWVPTGFSY